MKVIIRKEIHLLPNTFKALEKEAKVYGSNLKNHIELILNRYVEDKKTADKGKTINID